MPVPFITEAVLQQIVQAIAQAIWKRPELTPLREPIQTALEGRAFKDLTQQAFERLVSEDKLPYFDTGYIDMPLVQQHLAAYIVDGEATDVDELERLYIKRLPAGESAPTEIRSVLEGYLIQLRERFALHPTYGPILTTRDLRKGIILLHDLMSEVQAVRTALNQVLSIPEIREVVERRQGTHIFLSYSRHDAMIVQHVREALEATGHFVWQDVSAIKGGEAWLPAIDDGIKRAYALVLVLSENAWASEWVVEEFLHAQRHKKRIIPILIDGIEVPFGMNRLNPIQAKDDLDAGLQALATSVGSPQTDDSVRFIQIGDDPAHVETVPIDARQIEKEYLARLQGEHSLWLKRYTPMSGKAQQRTAHAEHEPKTVRRVDPRYERLRARMEEKYAPQPDTFEQDYPDDITQAVAQVGQLIVLGKPGAGKSTTLWHLTAEYVENALANANAPLPIYLRLGELEGHIDVRAALRAELAPLSFDDLLKEKRLILLLDALNELPQENRVQNIAIIKELAEQANENKTTFVVTCREEDYTGPLDLAIEEQARIAPLDVPRIQQFCINYEVEPLFWALFGVDADPVQRYLQAWQDDFASMWTSDKHPGGLRSWGPEVTTIERLRAALRDERDSRSMLLLARTPYMLSMMIDIYEISSGVLPNNRGDLFDTFVELLLIREFGDAQAAEAQTLAESLSNLAYHMQVEKLGTSIGRGTALSHLDETRLFQAASANLLTGNDPIRFTHQLLQEYFAAKRLDREMQQNTPATQFFPPENWWEPTGWEETAILLAGLYSDGCAPVINWLKDAQPELAARCVAESGAAYDAYDNLRSLWTPRLTDFKRDPKPQGRAAVGRGLGLLKLDNRDGVGLREDGLPNIAWCEVPGGKFKFGGDSEAYQSTEAAELDLPTIHIARFPVTYAQYEAFVDSDGYTNADYWTEAGREWKGDKLQPEDYWNDPRWHIANHPVVGVTWYEAYAFTQWLSQELGYEVRLPTEAEWEKAARGTQSLIYPYGNEFDAAKGNTLKTGISRTSAVGIFPNGGTPYPEPAYDISGNVLEWCLSNWVASYEHHEADGVDKHNTNSRVLRGGSWSYDGRFARAAYRNDDNPFGRSFGVGFRLCASAPILK